jgi:alanyl-tRNA synthetase
MTSAEIRNSFLNFFEERGHKIVPSAPVIPYDDPTLLFTNAGMNQFKDVFLGTGKRDYARAADTQKCIRVSGKHNDLEEVGRDTYHHTFFEMLGNWSFGNYYKKEAIEWAWELLTKVWGLDKKRLYATVYQEDDEAEQLWKQVTDIDKSHVLRFGKKDNFWEMGETGPCGPCSEIHIDLTDDFSGGKLVNAGDPRVMEIWNLVFIQYNNVAYDHLTPLPAKHVDTGMGFERICAVLQEKKSNYDTDVFTPIIQRIEVITGKKYTGTLDTNVEHRISNIDIAMRVIADHVRMLSFSIADGGIPSNEGRGYVMRRILRRAARFGRNLDMHEPFIYKVVEAVVKSMGVQFPEIKEKQNHIERVIKGEEESFNVTLDRGLEIFESVIQKIGNSKIFPGEDAFKLYDTYGFPLDMTEMMAKERGIEIDNERFNVQMKLQKERSRNVVYVTLDDAPDNLLKDIPEVVKQTRFDYELSETDVNSINEVFFFRARSGDEREANSFALVKQKTPFYPESGGQVGDSGDILLSDDTKLRIRDTKKEAEVILHFLDSKSKTAFSLALREGKSATLKIDFERRLNIMRNHTATHIVHEALRRVLGEHLHQQGSLVAPDHLRFDFNHFEKITHDQLKAIEEIVNEKISQSINVYALNDPKDWLTIEQAKKKYPNVKMFFGDKYGDRVRIVEIDPKFSVELCGGTHVKNTKDIGLFKIISESSIASGIRRIEAVTGQGLNQYIQKQIQKIGELDEHLAKLVEEKEILEKELGSFKKIEKSPTQSLGIVSLQSDQVTEKDIANVENALRQREETIVHVSKSTNDLKKELSKYRVKEAASSIDTLVSNGVALNGFKVVSAKIAVADAEELKSIGDTLRSKLSSGVGVLGAVVDEKVSLVCVVTDDLIKEKKLQAGKIVGEIAKRVGGGGGGRPHLATAGGKDISKLDEALNQTLSIIQSMLGK